MTLESELDLLSAILIFAAAVIPAYLSLKLRGNIRILTIALLSFILSHGLYHLVRMQGLETMADGLFEPASILLLLAFGATYVGLLSRKRKEPAKI